MKKLPHDGSSGLKNYYNIYNMKTYQMRTFPHDFPQGNGLWGMRGAPHDRSKPVIDTL